MEAETARTLFDANAATYDRVNTVISFGMDAGWRRWAARQAVTEPGQKVLDAFAGTGLVGLQCARLGAEVTLVDVSPGMLGVARTRARWSALQVTIAQGNLARRWEPTNAPFDAITMVFGARYVADLPRVLHQLAELLEPGGKLVLVDFVEPRHIGARLAGIYFFYILPWIASVLAGSRELYRQLGKTTHDLGPAENLVSAVETAGLRVEETCRMGFGLVCGVVARRE